MRTLRHLFEYVFILVFAWFLRLFPLKVVWLFAELLADFVFFLLPIRKKVIFENLTNAFKNVKTKKEIRAIALRTYRQFAKTFFEILYFPKLKPEDFSKLIVYENTYLLDEALNNGKGAVLVGSHFGNWELMGIALAIKYPITLIVGEQTNKYSDNLLNSFRVEKGVKIIPLKFALRGVMKTLKNNEFAGVVSDQDAHENGYFVNFFGRPASTPKAAAMFSMRADCPLLTGHCIRKGGKFHVVFDKIDFERTGNEEADSRLLTQLYTSRIEAYIRQYPDHWFWMHRRWKTQDKTNVNNINSR